MSLPPYIERPAPIAAIPPGFIGDAWVYAFGLRANLDAISACCAAYLNKAAGGNLMYEAALPLAVVTFLNAGRMTSAAPFGWMGERECAVWVPLLATEAGELGRVAKRLVWWMPYVFVDTDAAMATGREVWGYPKQIGTLTIPTGPPPQAGPWSLTTRLFTTLSPQTEGIEQPLLTVTGDASPGQPSNLWGSVTEAAGEVLAIIRREIAMPLWPSLSLGAEMLETLIHHEVPVVNLKQFRDAVDPTRACYQAIIEAPCTVQKFYGGGLLGGHYRVAITPAASHPIVSDLGLAGDDVDALYAAWCHMDFTAMTGQVVWQAGGADGPV